jgi:Tol biopolymer transport system component
MLARSLVFAASAVLLAGCSGVTTTPTPRPSAAGGSPSSASPSPSPADDAVAWIVYQSPNGLWLVDPDGARQQPALPEGPSRALHPDWSPDGSRLAFSNDEADGTRDLWLAAGDGSDPKRLLDCVAPCRDADGAAWSPDGGRIAFVRIDLVDGRNPGSTLNLLDVASGEVTTVASTDGADYLAGPRWSPDGTRLVVGIDTFTDDGNDTATITGRAIAVVDLGATPAPVRRLDGLPPFPWYPDWHPTEDRLVFGAGVVERLDPTADVTNLWTVRPDGSELEPLTDLGPTDDGVSMADWTPDGDGLWVTILDRLTGGLTLGRVALDGSVEELGGLSPVAGAHPRQRPTP